MGGLGNRRHAAVLVLGAEATDMVGYVHGSAVHGLALGYFPHGPARPGAVGLHADTLPRAMLAAALFGVLLLLFNYVLVRAARTHAAFARACLASADT